MSSGSTSPEILQLSSCSLNTRDVDREEIEKRSGNNVHARSERDCDSLTESTHFVCVLKSTTPTDIDNDSRNGMDMVPMSIAMHELWGLNLSIGKRPSRKWNEMIGGSSNLGRVVSEAISFATLELEKCEVWHREQGFK